MIRRLSDRSVVCSCRPTIEIVPEFRHGVVEAKSMAIAAVQEVYTCPTCNTAMLDSYPFIFVGSPGGDRGYVAPGNIVVSARNGSKARHMRRGQ